MKIGVVIVLLLLTCKLALAQGRPLIDRVKVIPDSPSTTDTIKINVKITVLELTRKIFEEAILIDNRVQIRSCFAISPSPASQTFNDTFTIGLLEEGRYIIDLRAFKSSNRDSCVKIDSNSYIDTFEVSFPVSSEDQRKSQNTVEVYPNPASDFVTFNIETGNIFFDITVFDYQGRQVMNKKGINGTTTIDVSSLNEGMYFFMMQTNAHSERGKFFVKRSNL